MTLTSTLAKRDTPEGRRYEAKIILYDCIVLVIGAIGLALSFPPLLYLAAVGHIVANFFVAPVKWLWPVIESLTLAIAVILFVAAVYLVQTFYNDWTSNNTVSYLISHWPLLLAKTVVLGGICSNLLAYPGNLDQLCEYIDRTHDIA